MNTKPIPSRDRKSLCENHVGSAILGCRRASARRADITITQIIQAFPSILDAAWKGGGRLKAWPHMDFTRTRKGAEVLIKFD